MRFNVAPHIMQQAPRTPDRAQKKRAQSSGPGDDLRVVSAGQSSEGRPSSQRASSVPAGVKKKKGHAKISQAAAADPEIPVSSLGSQELMHSPDTDDDDIRQSMDRAGFRWQWSRAGHHHDDVSR